MLIFDEKSYAETLLVHGFKRMMSVRDLSILAKYLKHIGKNVKQIRKDLEDFCIKFNPSFNPIISDDIIDYALGACKKYKLRLPNSIMITQSELEIIKTIDDYKCSKVYFIMLATAKYFSQNRTSIKPKKSKLKEGYTEGFYINERFTGILKIAHVNISKKERYEMMNNLYLLGKIEATYTGAYKINGIESGSASGSAILIDDLNNLYRFYPVYCTNCGKLMEYKPKRRDMCDECYVIHRKNKVLENVKRFYENKKLVINQIN